MYKKSTQVPNVLLDYHLKALTEGELKLILVVVRQTYGWVDKRTRRRKTRDRISHSQFMIKTGLCKRVISKALQSLVIKGLLVVYDQSGNLLPSPIQRKGVQRLFYSFQPMYERALYKTNYPKLNETKLRRGSVQSVGEIVAGMAR